MNLILVVLITNIMFVILIMNGKHMVKQKNKEKLATISQAMVFKSQNLWQLFLMKLLFYQL